MTFLSNGNSVVCFVLQCICYCLEVQFDSVIQDRTMILQKLYLLSVVLNKRAIFTWQFFLNR